MSFFKFLQRAVDNLEIVAAGREGALVIGPEVPLTVAPEQVPSRSFQREWLVIGPSSAIAIVPDDQGVAVGPGTIQTIQPPQRGAWDEHGWTSHREKNALVYEGSFQILQRRTRRTLYYPGRIILEHGQAAAYIADPPAEIRRHPKGPCFMLVQAPWFRVNWAHPAGNADDAILYVEKILDEAVNYV